MLCSLCQKIFRAEFDQVHVGESSRFRHHPSLAAFRESTTNGCILCSVIWYQFPPWLRDTVNRQSNDSTTNPVTYTVDEFLRRMGRYKLDFFTNESGSTSYRLDVIEVDDLSDRQEHLANNASNAGSSQDKLSFNSAVERASQWLRICNDTHESCRQRQPPVGARKAFRLLEVGLDGRSILPRVRDTSELTPGYQYLTLSHCWGDLEIKCLTTKSLPKLKEGVDGDSLPKTFQDAIRLVRQLGHQYIWIDSLCIIQDDPDDWREQAALMADIYQNSRLNIAATSAKDGSQGLFSFFERLITPLEPMYIQIKENEALATIDFSNDDEVDELFAPRPHEKEPWLGFAKGTYEVLDRELVYRNITDSPLGRRAWIVQERLLAPCTLHFARDQMFWECNELKACELYPLGLPERANLLSSANLKSKDTLSGPKYPPDAATPADWNDISPSPQILQSWDQIVKAYSGAALTYEKDKLIALHGLAESFQSRIRAPYIAGMWAAHLHRQLLWAIRTPQEPPNDSRAPTWSWMSVHGEVAGVVGIYDTIERRLATILDVSVQGDISKRSGALSIRGRLIPCTLSLDPDARTNKQCNPTVRGLHRAAFVSLDVSTACRKTEDLLSNRTFFCLPTVIFRDKTEPTTAEVAGLLLADTDQKGVFQRFGAFRTDNAMDRDGDVPPNWFFDRNLPPKTRTQVGRVFLTGVEDERSEIEERLYERYERCSETDGFGNFVFSVI